MAKNSKRILVVVFLSAFLMAFLELVIPRIIVLKYGIFNVLEYLPYLYISFALGSFLPIISDKKSSIYKYITLFIPVLFLSSFLLFVFSDDRWLINLSVFFIIAAIGVLISHSYTLGRYNLVFLADMVGIGFGGGITFFLLPVVGLEYLFIILFLLSIFLIYIYAFNRFIKRLILIVLTLAIASVVYFSYSHVKFDYFDLRNRSLNVNQDFFMHIENEVFKPRIIASRWGMISRVDLVVNERSPLKTFFPIDSLDDNNLIIEKNLNYSYDTSLYYNGSFFSPVSSPYYFKDLIGLNNICQYKSALLIGVGGGIDYHYLRSIGVEQITGCEINDAAVDILNLNIHEDFYNKQPSDNYFVIDGRTMLKYGKETYDVIMMSFAELYIPFPKSKVYMESYLYTKEAILEMYDKLNKDGVIIINKWSSIDNVNGNNEMLKLTITILEALKGLTPNFQNHLYVFAYNFGFGFLERDSYVSIYLFKNPNFISCDYISELGTDEFIKVLWAPNYFADKSSESNVYFSNQIIKYLHLSNINKSDEFFDNTISDFSPATDDKPFFYQFEKSKIEVKKRALFFLIISFFMIVAGGLIAYKKYGLREKRNLTILTVLSFIVGIAFSLLQISLLQKFTVFLGSPLYSLFAILCLYPVLIGFSGLFSKMVNKKFLAFNLLAFFLVYLVFYFFLDSILFSLFSMNVFKRILVVLLMIIPYAAITGHFFPSILKLTPEASSFAALFNMTNVLGGTLGVVVGTYIAMQLGFLYVETLSFIMYGFVTIVLFKIFTIRDAEK
ncbi:MAG: class I SAM-dependent methyltransferase [Bacteroidales bacterium]|nr:class I SAM-dependent methyltransferase [Bacteroidales bacterium]